MQDVAVCIWSADLLRFRGLVAMDIVTLVIDHSVKASFFSYDFTRANVKSCHL